MCVSLSSYSGITIRYFKWDVDWWFLSTLAVMQNFHSIDWSVPHLVMPIFYIWFYNHLQEIEHREVHFLFFLCQTILTFACRIKSSFSATTHFSLRCFSPFFILLTPLTFLPSNAPHLWQSWCLSLYSSHSLDSLSLHHLWLPFFFFLLKSNLHCHLLSTAFSHFPIQNNPLVCIRS